MSDILTIALLVPGFFVLLKGAGMLVEGASSIAIRLKLSNLIIGLTVVAFGTSAPELFVSVYATIDGNPDIAVSNVLGSNMANLYVILGATTMMMPLSFQQSTAFKEIPYSLLAALVVGILAFGYTQGEDLMGTLSRIDGVVLLGFFVLFMYYIIRVSKTSVALPPVEIINISRIKSTLYVLIGLAGLVLGGHWIVNGAIAIADYFAISQSLIGLTIVAIGTSLPELATTLVATKRRKMDIAIGNVIGSNIFNIFLILGISATIKPLPFRPSSYLDLMMIVFSNILLLFCLYWGRKFVLQRWQGLLFILIYAGYIVFRVLNE